VGELVRQGARLSHDNLLVLPMPDTAHRNPNSALSPDLTTMNFRHTRLTER
jgi:hypothetical protein